MTKKDNKTCLICGKKYSYCGTCREFAHLPSWKELVDTENCYNLFEILSAVSVGTITKEQGKAKLAECDLNQEFTKEIKKQIEDIQNITVADTAKVDKVIKEANEVIKSVDETEKKVRRTKTK